MIHTYSLYDINKGRTKISEENQWKWNSITEHDVRSVIRIIYYETIILFEVNTNKQFRYNDYEPYFVLSLSGKKQIEIEKVFKNSFVSTWFSI